MEGIKQLMARARSRACDRGASLVEYALMVALITVVCIGAVTQLGGESNDGVQRGADGLGGSNSCSSYEEQPWHDVHVGTGDGSHQVHETTDGCFGQYRNDPMHYYLGPVPTNA
jgi:Flp pilus assembly pilin Flp